MPDQRAPGPRITVVSCLRDEGPYVVDWVAHLRALGVATVLVYTNDCSDGTEDILEALRPAGVIHVPQGDVLGQKGSVPQWRALQAAWTHGAVTEADWVLHLDVDEWIALDASMGLKNLSDLIDLCPDAEAIAMGWRLFGNNGRLAPGQGSPAERFQRAAPRDMVYPALGSFCKTLFRRHGPFDGLGVHRPKQTAPPVLYDDTGTKRPEMAQREGQILMSRDPKASARRVQVNHYSVRSVHEFLVKRSRGLPNRTGKAIDLTYWVERNFNTEACNMIAAQLPACSAEAARLRALPMVAEAEACAVAWHGARLAEILASPAGARLCGRLILAGDSHVPTPELGRHLLRQGFRAERTSR
ncbi:hypothetical protein JANAI62_27440 [Jannaschia pagri]|uniref:Glycosyl transferase family 2 n=1 Tax=Jannaschia pagri TaxID=2829797 RepID=A0ABQ4NP52_9RHOB|nr:MULTISPECIES: glycosyltransferase family 2 protein [unclassified Jannaschia]GIT92287.1 hypothetical protein JANAI61_27450 [Jannaschia sp. AI_61]GIT96121.1 hypothetical protein JANAI62_27440 [Jannaschia sp. AI_62]